jgi:protocatechuate 3,4-dioxygenase beta subunit
MKYVVDRQIIRQECRALWCVIFCLAAYSPLCAQQQQTENSSPGATIAGRVDDSFSRSPLREVRIVITKVPERNAPAEVFNTQTDDNGRYATRALVPGRYTVAAYRPGYQPRSYGRPGKLPAVPFSILAGQHRTDVNISMLPGAVITGVVRDADGDPVRGAKISAQKARYFNGGKQPGQVVVEAMSNDLGEYRLAGLAAGTYFVAGLPARATSEVYYPRTFDPRAALSVAAESGQTIAGVNLDFPEMAGVPISGRVLNQTNLNLSNMQVVLSAKATVGVRERSLKPDALGNFSFEMVPPGEYVLDVRTRTTLDNVFVSRTSLRVGKEALQNIAITMTLGFEVSGRVNVTEKQAGVTEKRMDPQTLQVRLAGLDGIPGRVASPAADGSFKFTGVSPGMFNLTVDRLGEEYYVRAIRAGSNDYVEDVINLTRGGSDPIQIEVIHGAGSVSGTAVDQDGKPVAGATVVLVPQGQKRRALKAFYRNVLADPEGKFKFSGLPLGEYQLFGWPEIEDDLWMDPEFLTRVDSKGKKLTIHESSAEAVDLNVIQAVN